MSRTDPTTLYFAVGFFTADQLAENHRATLARAAQNVPVPDLRQAAAVVAVTVFNVDIGTDTVDMAVSKVSMVEQNSKTQASGVSFAIERFDSTRFPGASTAQDAFVQYLSSEEGIASFGNATAVQLFSIDVGAAPDLEKA